MGWVIFIIVCVVVYYLFISNRSSPKSKTDPKPYLMTPTVKSTTQRRTTDYTKPQTSIRETQIRRLLQQAYESHHRLTMTYETGNPIPGDPAIKTRDVDLYGVGDDYIDAFCYYRNEQRTFKISRIISVRLLEDRYEIPSRYTESGWVTDGWDEIEGELGEDN